MLKYLSFILFLSSLWGCTKFVTDQFPDHLSLPVVNATLVAGDSVKLNLSFSHKVDTSAIIYCNNAIVQLYKNGQFVEYLTNIHEGYYVSSTCLVEEDATYLCKIVISGYDTINASTYIPSKTVIRYIDVVDTVGISEEGQVYSGVAITFTNKLGCKNYYSVRMKFYYPDNDIQGVQFVYFSDNVILNEGIPKALFSSELINDSLYTLHLNFWRDTKTITGPGYYKDVLRPFDIEFSSISYDYYMFYKSFYLYTMGRFADGVINPMGNSSLYSNIENGYGIFCGYTTFTSEIVYPDE